MRSILTAIIVALTGLGVGVSEGAVSLTALNDPYTQNFDTLGNSGTSSLVPDGWAFSESGSSANTIYTAGAGTDNTGDTYSFGASASTERALGGLQSGSLVPVFGVQIFNQTGATISDFVISYVGEQWRFGDATRTPANTADRLDFQYSLDATSLTVGTWNDSDTFDFTSPVVSGTAGALNGNLSANQTLVSGTLGGLSLANGSSIWFRWNDFNVNGFDDGLGIDGFSITAVPEPAEWGLICAVGLLGVCGLHTWRERRRASRQSANAS